MDEQQKEGEVLADSEDEEDFNYSSESSEDDDDEEEETEENNEKEHKIIVDEPQEIYCCHSLAEAEMKIHSYELRTNTRFVSLFSKKLFGNTDIYAKPKNVYWDKDGVAFITLSHKTMECHQGPDRNLGKKAKYSKQSEKASEHSVNRKNLIIQSTKKRDCPADIKMQEIVSFPEFKSSSGWQRKKFSKAIRTKLEEKTLLDSHTFERKIIVEIDSITKHQNHFLGQAGLNNKKIDPEISKLIREYVERNGVIDVREVKNMLKTEVHRRYNGEISQYNRRFYPSNKDIRTHISMTQRQNRYSMIDQECLEQKIKQWSSSTEVKVKFRCKTTEGEKFLFVYQEKWQQDLFQRYGDEMVLLDATYRTTRYALPLFFLTVKTNIDYQIVAEFIIESETKDDIKEALLTIKGWNPNITPKFGMTDYCIEEIAAIEEVYPSCQVLICDFHREQAWGRWLSKTNNGCSKRKKDILPLIRRVARCFSLEEVDLAFNVLKKSEFWTESKYVKFQTYLSNYWMKIKERWILAYRTNRFLASCNTNNGVERQNGTFKHRYLRRHRNSSITVMMSVLIEDFLPEKMMSYNTGNLDMDERSRAYKVETPVFLKNRPRHFVPHCLKKIAEAAKSPIIPRISKFGVFEVQSSSNRKLFHTVELGDSVNLPYCSCRTWVRYRFLCKHFFIIFKTLPLWSFDSLSPFYLNSPFLTIDLQNHAFKTNPPMNLSAPKCITPEDFPDLGEEETNPEHCVIPVDKKEDAVSIVGDVRELLGHLQNMTHELEPSSFEMKEMYKVLAELTRVVESGRRREDNLPLRKNANPSDMFYIANLKKRPKKVTSKRIGEKKETMVNASKIKIEDEEEGHFEELITDGMIDGQETFSVNLNSTDKAKNTENFSSQKIPNLTSCGDSIETGKSRPDKLTLPKHCTDTQIVDYFPRCKVKWAEIREISDNQMLSDNVINYFQTKMKAQYTGGVGLQDCVLGQRLAFKPFKNKPFVQVLHNGRLHWLAISTYGCSNGEVWLLDSLFRGNVTVHIKKQIACIMQTDAHAIKIKIAPVQQQTFSDHNGTDCGLFAVAFCLHVLVNGTNQTEARFDQSKFRSHALKCMMEDIISAFPIREQQSRQCNEGTLQISVYCTCRQTWINSDGRKRRMEMVQCESCCEWYHWKCEKVNESMVKGQWTCSRCNN